MGDFFADMAANRGPIDPNRVPFTLSISDITSNGEVQILFSEEMYSIKDMEPSGMTFKLFQRLRKQVVKLNYKKNAEEGGEEEPGRRRLQEDKTTAKLADGSETK